METFVVRVWTPAGHDADDPERDVLRGFVEHVASGQRSAFVGDVELLAFVAATLDPRRQEVDR